MRANRVAALVIREAADFPGPQLPAVFRLCIDRQQSLEDLILCRGGVCHRRVPGLNKRLQLLDLILCG